jgi:hypothetical protein
MLMLMVMMVYRQNWLQNRKKIRKAGGVPAMGALMPKSVFDYG